MQLWLPLSTFITLINTNRFRKVGKSFGQDPIYLITVSLPRYLYLSTFALYIHFINFSFHMTETSELPSSLYTDLFYQSNLPISSVLWARSASDIPFGTHNPHIFHSDLNSNRVHSIFKRFLTHPTLTSLELIARDEHIIIFFNWLL